MPGRPAEVQFLGDNQEFSNALRVQGLRCGYVVLAFRIHLTIHERGARPVRWSVRAPATTLSYSANASVPAPLRFQLLFQPDRAPAFGRHLAYRLAEFPLMAFRVKSRVGAQPPGLVAWRSQDHRPLVSGPAMVGIGVLDDH